MFKKACILFVAAALPLFSAHAGQRYSPRVQIVRATGENPMAYGSLTGTHNSPDGSSMIECTITSWPAVTGVTCQARVAATADTKGDFGTCFTEAPELVNTVRSINPSDVLHFGWDKAGNCTMIELTHTSTVGSAAQAL